MWVAEHTDTYAGEANYNWVNVYDLPVKTYSRLALVRAAKKACGLAGVRSTVVDHGDQIVINPHGLCQIVFVTWKEDES